LSILSLDELEKQMESKTAATIATDLTQSELDRARTFLNQTQNEVAGATRGLSPAQWDFKPAPDRWSIAENLEHVVMVQEAVLGRVREQLANAPASRNCDRRQVDDIVITGFPDRTARFTAPEFVYPSGRWTPSEAFRRLRTNYSLLAEYLETTPDLRQHAVEALPLKAVTKGAYETMDGYQWVLAAAAHAERHVKQILEVKADSNFPVA
jgi:hypothetical protein